MKPRRVISHSVFKKGLKEIQLDSEFLIYSLRSLSHFLCRVQTLQVFSQVQTANQGKKTLVSAQLLIYCIPAILTVFYSFTPENWNKGKLLAMEGVMTPQVS